MHARRSGARSALSLLEVLLALTIFLLGLIAIGQLINLAGDRAVEVKLEGQATQLCESKLAEVVAGVVSLTSQSDVPFEDDPDWSWSLEAEQSSVAGLWQVQVTVARPRPGGSRVECKLGRLLLDPALRGTTLAEPAAPAASSTSSSATATPSTDPSTTGTK
jgi:type II secretory pathway pseudopilin PulG